MNESRIVSLPECQFLTSAAHAKQFPSPDQPEIAFSGRSNVGKSSLLNFLTGQKNLAKVSKTPGKTRTINFFSVQDSWRLVDLPGYGFAKVGKSEVKSWQKLIDGYLRERQNLVGIVQLLDSRHAPSAIDEAMLDWLAETGITTLVALTKTDKLRRNEARSVCKKFRKEYSLPKQWTVIATSTLEQSGFSDLLRGINGLLGKNVSENRVKEQ